MGCKEGIFFPHNEHRRPWGRALITRERWRSTACFLFQPEGLPQPCSEHTRDTKERLVKRALQISLYLMLKQTAIITGHYLAALEHLRLG